MTQLTYINDCAFVYYVDCGEGGNDMEVKAS